MSCLVSSNLSSTASYMYCYKHPKVETGLSCGKCERPICTNCMIVGPAGVRCRECASLRGSPLYQVSPARLILATLVALVVGVVGAAVLCFINFFVLFVAPVYGGVMAQAVTWASGRKRGPVLDAIAESTSIALGALLWCYLSALALVLHSAASSSA